MSDSPMKQKSTSKVIDGLHSEIDVLKDELENLKVSHSDYKKRNTNLANKNESLVEQLANCKHENDMINALLKRKERRIADLEGEFDDMSSETEALRQSVKNYKIRCDNLSESSASSTAEFERLKISYDALMASQVEYKRHYQDQVAALAAQLEEYKQESAANLERLVKTQEKQEKDQEALVESLTSRNKSMELVYFNKNKATISALALLANVAKLHGEESKSLLHDNVEIINAAREHNPKLAEILSERTEATIDLDELLKDSEEKLDISFDSNDPGPSEEQNKAGNKPVLARKKRNRRSMRIPSPDFGEHETLPKVRGAKESSRRSPSSEGPQNVRRNSSQRRSSNAPVSRASSGSHRQSQASNNASQTGGNAAFGKSSFGSGTGWTSHSSEAPGRKAHGNNNNNAKNSKRRSFHGGSSHYNSGSERRVSSKADADA